MRAASFFIFTTVLCCTALAAPSNNNRGYIIKLKPQADQAFLLNFVNEASALHGDVVAKITHSYHPDFFNGFAGEFSKDFLKQFQREHAGEIEYIERDGIVRINAVQDGAPWGLVRVGSKTLDPTNKKYDYPDKAGEGVTAYVIDTGVDVKHPDFNGRISKGANFITDEADDDLNGHGTHCAGTIASSTYGVAKKANVVGVKVLDAGGSGTYSGVIAGVNWVFEKVKSNGGLNVISMSLGGPKNQALNDAITAASGVLPVIVAAGNEYGSDACKRSPAGATGAFAVGATDSADKRASFSNVGPCVKISAPGVDVLSSWLNGGTNTISGTSMACPHVAGIAALYLSERTFANSDALYKAIQDNASAATTGLKIAYNKLA